MSGFFSRIPSCSIQKPGFASTIYRNKEFFSKLFPKLLNLEFNKDIIISEKELALSSLDYLDQVQITDDTEYDENQLSEAFDSSMD